MVGAKVRKGWPGHPRVERRSAPAGCPACRCRDDASCLLRCQQGPGGFELESESTKRALCTQSGGGINRQPWTPGGICSGPYPLASRQWAGGRTRCYTVRGLCISTLHVSLIIRVLPRAESATGCIFRQRRFCAGAIHVQGRYFRSIRRALRGSDGRAEVQRKESGKQVKHRTCRFFSVFSTQRWWRFQAIR